MDSAATIDAVREATATELDRLGSDKLLIALTGATLETPAVHDAVGSRERGVAEALEQWATDEEDAVAVDAFVTAAGAAADRADDLDAAAGESDALGDHLSTVDGTAARVGAGLIAVPLLADRLYLQAVNFFVNEADESSANQFRSFRTEANSLEHARVALGTLDDADRTVARDAAVETIEVAYTEYAATLESMGLDPRPIC